MITFFQQVFAAIKLLQGLLDGARQLGAFIEKNRNEKWFQDFGRAIDNLEKVDQNPAATDEEKERAFKDYLRSLRGLR